MFDDASPPQQATIQNQARTEAMDRRIEARHPLRRRLLWAAAAGAAALALLGLAAVAPRPGSLLVRSAQVQISEVVRKPFQDYLPIRAEVAPARTVLIGAISGGQVARVIAADGSEVAAGQVLATLSNPQLKLEVSARAAEISGRLGDATGQQLGLQTARADRARGVAEAQFGLLRAEHDLAVRQKLHDQGIVSDAELKTYAADAAYYRERVRALQVEQAREDATADGQAAVIRDTAARLTANLKDVESSLQALTVTAPVAGRLTNFSLQPGQSLKLGDPVGQIDSEGDYKLIADVDEFYLGRVEAGLPAHADLGDASYDLVVAKVLPQVSNGRFRIELGFKGAPPPSLKRGQSMDLRLTFGAARPALVLDNGAWLEASGGAYAFVLQSSGRQAIRRPIRVGRRNPDQVEITAGLQLGERVVTSSYVGFEKYQRLILDRKERP